MVETIDHVSAGVIQVLGVPIKLSDTPGAVRTAPPALGQHTDRILREDCGLTAEYIDALRASKTI
jgi:crotonobetainyl-CoA:carnitine CoA-transferase CaiB-like acyl-CoA transferase